MQGFYFFFISILSLIAILTCKNFKLASNLPLEQWLQDSLQNLTNANQLILNLKYGNVENAKLISGSLMYDAIVNIRKKVAGSKNEIYIYSVVSKLVISESFFSNI